MPATVEEILTPRFAMTMLRAVSVRTGSPVYDEDLAQEALLRFLHAVQRHLRIDCPQALFVKIVQDLLYDFWRKRREMVPLESFRELQATGLRPDELIDRERQHQATRSALTSLSVADQEVIGLYYMQEFSVRHISQLLGKSPSAIKMSLFRSRRNISRQILQSRKAN